MFQKHKEDVDIKFAYCTNLLLMLKETLRKRKKIV